MRDEKIITSVMNKLIECGYQLTCYVNGTMLMVKKSKCEIKSAFIGEKALSFCAVTNTQSKNILDESTINYENVSLESLDSERAYVCDQKNKMRWSLEIGRKSAYGEIYTRRAWAWQR